MSEVFRVQATKGMLTITETTITLEFGSFRSRSLLRSSLSSVETKRGVPSVFGLGGGTHLIFHGKGGERIDAGMVKPKLAQEIVAALGT